MYTKSPLNVLIMAAIGSFYLHINITVAGSELSVNQTYSKFDQPVCYGDQVTITCSTFGRNLVWHFNDEFLKSYNADDTCGNFDNITRIDGYHFSVLLGGNLTGEEFSNCTAIMKLTPLNNTDMTANITCTTTGNSRTQSDVIILEILGKQQKIL